MLLLASSRPLSEITIYGFAPPCSCILQDYSCLPCDAPPRGIEIEYRHCLQHNVLPAGSVETWNEKMEDEEKKIQKVLMTGLGTGVGKISPAACTRQMTLVIKHFLCARSEEGQRSWVEYEA
ncbi:hypothetical protein EDC04DRAFT_2568086 [Pisolithus marmoratus]|nr:hypothetical protein EDC04DRAFT_2568086 [Pisolithus marmoratus]